MKNTLPSPRRNAARRLCFWLLLAAPLAASTIVSAQANTDTRIDLLLADIDDLSAVGRVGTFPDGVNGCALETTACNAGTREIAWHAAMSPSHPFIAFLIARESQGRFEQISDRSFVKHGFFALANEFCSTCTSTGGTSLGLGCSDTYTTANNSDNFWLGPPDEIDPWLGQWDPPCSHFDRGEPAVPPPQDCNGLRSLTSAQANALGPVGHRIQVRDADFAVAGASFWFQGMYVIAKEGEDMRDDNLASRAFTPVWTGSRWNLNESGVMQHGSVLERWSGASVTSVTNGGDDGRLYLAVKVTGPEDGFYHYEYALHNRDNFRGVGALRIPLCGGARVRDAGFGDVDQDAGNDWSIQVGASEIEFSTSSNPLRWNSVFNFWFDSDAAPAAGVLALDQADAGAGLASLALTSSAPLGLFNVYLGAGCALDTPPSLHAVGAPAQATLGNASFALRSTGNAALQPSVLYLSLVSGSLPFAGCTLYLGATAGHASIAGRTLSDANGVAVHAAPVPSNLALEGLSAYLQAVSRDPGNGPLFGSFELSDGLHVRLGSMQAGCP